MGLFVSRILESFTGLQEKRLLLLGLDAAGELPFCSVLGLCKTVMLMKHNGDFHARHFGSNRFEGE